jgi:alkyl hydroperoxide reductase subunit AhpC
MKRIGQRALTFRLPAIVDGTLTYIHPQQFEGQWVALCFVPHLGRVEIDLLNRQGKDLEELGSVLLVVPLESRACERQRSIDCDLVHCFVVGDPSGRLRRLYGGVTTQSLGRGRTFLIDPEGVLRFHMTHSLSERGMAVVREVIQAHQDEEIAALL